MDAEHARLVSSLGMPAKFGVPERGGAHSLHGLQKRDAIDVVASSAVLNGLLEVHAVLRHNYQRLLVVTKCADLFALRRDVKLFDRAVP